MTHEKNVTVFVQELLAEQVAQGNPRNPEIFVKIPTANRSGGGIDWMFAKHPASYWYNWLSYTVPFRRVKKELRKIMKEEAPVGEFVIGDEKYIL